MSDGEAERMTDPAPQWSDSNGCFLPSSPSFLELLYDMAVEVSGVQRNPSVYADLVEPASLGR